MGFGLYQPGTSPLHRLPAGAKLLGLAAGAALLSAVRDPAILGAGLVGTAALVAVSGLRPLGLLAQIRLPLALVLLVAAGHAVFGDPAAGGVLALRFGALLLLAALVTATTPLSAMADAILVPLTPLRRLGWRTERVGFAVMLALRLIPAVAEEAARIREAQRARGGAGSALTLAMPLLVACLRMADRLAEAIDARGGPPG